MTERQMENVQIKLRAGRTIELSEIVETHMQDDFDTYFQSARDASGSEWSRRKNKFYGWSKWLKKGMPSYAALDSMSAAEIAQL